ncbi:MAG: DUF1330 domain-containing protein [Myxococcota bacterium]
MPASQPRPEQIEGLVKRHPEGDLYMLNLLKFREKAIYADGRETDLSGQQAYMIYGGAVQQIIEGFGGGLVFGGVANALVIGDGELEWDWIGLMRYPSFAHFQGMTASDEYQAIHVHRDAGLEHQVLINCLDLAQSMERLQAAVQA